MSAIAGILLLDGRPVAPPVLERMVGVLAHRGPNGAGVWSEGSIGLGHRMLWTTRESLHEKMPLASKSGDLILTADARLDNRDELIVALGVTGRPREMIGDGELILEAYERWGERCPEKLLGDFAFAIWDKRRQTLLCARDHSGVKPFYYYRSGCAFVFASEIKALLCVPEVPRRLNEVMVADYLVPTFEDKTITFYRGIHRLPPAHKMEVNRKGAPARPYWSLDTSHEVRLASDEEYAEAFLELFTEAVRCRLRSAFPVGSLLSGGLDSSSIVCVARGLLAEKRDRRLHTFSALFDEVPQCDERAFIGAVLAPGGLEPHMIRADLLSPLTDLKRVLWHEDEAFYAPNLFMHWGLWRSAHQQKIRVLLDGIDGDTTVSHGLAYLTELARAGRWVALAAEISVLSGQLNASPWFFLLHRAFIPLAPNFMRQAWRMLRRRNHPPGTADTIISLHFARRIGLVERVQALEQDRLRPARTSREEHWRGLTTGILPFFLEVADRGAGAFSIEPRYPFFDRRLVEFCLALPPEQKLSQGWTRVVMRRALANVLPEEITWRGGKSDLSPNFNRGLLMSDRELLEEVILKDSQVIEEYVDVAALRETYHRYVSYSADADALAIWKAATLALWLRRVDLTP